MPKYLVDLERTATTVICLTVEADNEDEAEIVDEQIQISFL